MNLPIDQTKRTFLKTAALSGACLLCGGIASTLLESCESGDSQAPPPTTEKGILEINSEPELLTIGGAIKKRYAGVNGGRPMVIIRTSEKDFAVFAAQCTHKTVEIKLPKDGIMKCPAHGSQYRTDGTVIEGQAKKPLYKIASAFDASKKTLTIG